MPNRETNTETMSHVHVDQVLLDQFTLRTYTYTYIYLYILHIIYIYIYISVVALFSNDWLLPFDDEIHLSLPVSSLDCPRDVTFSIYYFIYVRASNSFEKKRNKIDVLSEESYPLRRGGATGRAEID